MSGSGPLSCVFILFKKKMDVKGKKGKKVVVNSK